VEGAHRTRIKRRHGLCLVSCSCGWSEEVVSNFGAWLASRRHLDSSRTAGGAREWSVLGSEPGRRHDRPFDLEA
jgi:hypothetical protein